MPKTAASLALSRCLRSQRILAACTRNGAALNPAWTCIAGAICPARRVSSIASATPPLRSRTSTSPVSIPPSIYTNSRTNLSITLQRPARPRRHSSSIQGTIGSGSAGVPQEAARALETLTAPEHLNEKELQIWTTLQRELQPTSLEVQDISGGCGSMYGIQVVSERFRGLSMLKQQRLVNGILGEEIKGWHGVQLKTAVP